MTFCDKIEDTRVSTHLRRSKSGLRYPSSSILVSSAIHTNTRYRTSHVTNSKQYVQPCLLYKEVRSPLQALQSVLGAKQVLKNMLLLCARIIARILPTTAWYFVICYMGDDCHNSTTTSILLCTERERLAAFSALLHLPILFFCLVRT